MSPKLLATYDLTPDVQLYAQLAVGFRAPTVDELYSRFYNRDAAATHSLAIRIWIRKSAAALRSALTSILAVCRGA